MKFFSIVLVLAVFFLGGCQESATGNKNLLEPINLADVRLKYPLKTGQRDTYTYLDISDNSFYFDDGQPQAGYARVFNRLPDETVYNANYDLYWQDNNATLDYNYTSAQTTCADLDFAGKTDWRLPNIYELVTLLDIGSNANLRVPEFLNMPEGVYFSSQSVPGSKKTLVVGFAESDFNVTKIDKENDVDVNESVYGTLVGANIEPKYSSKGYLVTITDTKTYYSEETLLQTIIGTVTAYDENGTVTNVSEILEQEIPLHPPELSTVVDESYVKCVSGPEIGGFDFVRDDRNEVVVDRSTLLMWQDNREILLKNVKWGEALQYCTNLELAGYEDWRLPTIGELVTINDFNDTSTYSVDKAFKYKAANKFHTSSNTCVMDGEGCYQQNFQLNTCGFLEEKITDNKQIDANPYDNNTSEPYYKVRCVRAGGYN